MASAAIEVHELHKRYGDVEAVRGLSFRVERGEVVGLLGPNGAGKTTTVEILEGYRDRTAGEVSVLGHDPADAPPTPPRVGSSPERRVLPARHGPEALRHFAGYYPAARRGRDDRARGPRGQADVRVNHLSGGQRRRLDLALALVGDPELVFLDEPTTGFDPAARRTAWGVVRALKELGKTVLLTTHYLDEAQELSDRVAIVKDGRIVAEGPPDQLGAGQLRLPDHIPAERPPRGARDRRPHRAASPAHPEALERGERLEGLDVTRPRLEEVYLELTAGGGR